MSTDIGKDFDYTRYSSLSSHTKEGFWSAEGLKPDIGKDFDYTRHSSLSSHTKEWSNNWVALSPYFFLLIIEEQALTNQERTPLSYCSQKYSPHPSHFLSKPSCIRHLLSCIWITFKFFFLIFKTSFQKRKKSDPVSEHRLSAIPLPLLNVNREKISSQSWPKNRVAEILYSFSLSVEGE